MSYTNTTTHYQWPLPEETDLFNGLDDNPMKEDIDEKLYNLEQQSTGDHEAVTQLNSRVTEVEQTVSGYDTQIEELEGTVGEHAERLINLTNRQTELSRRLGSKAGESTIAAEYNEEESYLVGDFVYYANILYKCKVASATPAGSFDSDNWDIAILTDELGGSTPTPGSIAAANVSFDDAVSQLGASNVQTALVALKTLVDNIGGGSMPFLNFSTPLHSFSDTNAFTATKDCWLCGTIGGTAQTSAQLKIDGAVIAAQAAGSQHIYPMRIKAGQAVQVTQLGDTTYGYSKLALYDEL